ncbi:MAG: 3-hydroxyacyl-CoA dehydrogenase [Thiotrichales bacterium]|nr:3-hydroxyacyl-CoA dehydrogenase [Thiotrichales bacterium]
MATQFRVEGSVGVITMMNPPVNALGQGLRAGLLEALGKLASDDSVTGGVLIGDGRCFSAGADITEFGKPRRPPGLTDVMDALESSTKPVVAAIHGTALGGGLELALCCHYRVADAAARVGLPEVKIGLIPGAGGTQRLPRLTGVEAAVEVITSGRMVPAAEALTLGIVSAVYDSNLESRAIDFIQLKTASQSSHPRVRDSAVPDAPAPDFFDARRDAVAKRAKGQTSPLSCVDAVQAACEHDFDAGLQRESDIFSDCMASDQCEGLIHYFFAERMAAKIPGLSEETEPRNIQTAAVIGAGTMGGGISMCFANTGIPVTVVDTDDEALERGMATVKKNYARSVSRGSITQAQMDERLSCFTTTTDIADIADVDMVIEAVFENLALKCEIFGRLDRVVKAGAVLATNTSTLDINKIAAATERPDDVIGMHFFSPANVMKLCEIVRGAKTSDAVIRSAMAVAKTIGKISALVGVCDGFVGNRMLHKYHLQAGYMIEDGALPWDVDRVFVEFGMPMGPFAMSDLAGLDVGYRVRQEQAKTRPSNVRYVDISDTIVELGRHGQKTGAGYYKYEDGARVGTPDPEIEELIVASSKKKGIERRAFDDDEIKKRLLYSMINEGAKILEEGIAIRPGDIDVIYVNGYGFPAWRGGPMKYADSVGLDKLVADIDAFQAQDGAGWEASDLLRTLAAEGKTFESYQRDT